MSKDHEIGSHVVRRPVDSLRETLCRLAPRCRSIESISSHTLGAGIDMKIGVPRSMRHEGTTGVQTKSPRNAGEEIHKLEPPRPSLLNREQSVLLDARFQSVTNVDRPSRKPSMKTFVVIPKNSQGVTPLPKSMHQPERFHDATPAVNDVTHKDHTRMLTLAGWRNIWIQQVIVPQALHQLDQLIVAAMHIADHIELS